MSRLRITEIFCSLQGETRTTGLPTTFVRLTGCPLRCGYCDTSYAFRGGEWLELETILARVAGFGVRHVTVTGGEPLAQKECLPLLTALCDAGYSVSLETSGAIDIAGVDPRVSKVMDLKSPGSGESGCNRWENLAHLQPTDEIKFVLCDRTDYDWAVAQIAERGMADLCDLLMSPVHGTLPPAELAGWIVTDRLPVRFQMQLHKLLWGDAHGV